MLLHREPVLIAALVRATVVLATAFGLHWDAQRIGAVMLFTETLLAFLVRGQITSPATLAAAIPTTAAPSATAQS